MNLLPLDTLGAREVEAGVVDFGVFFPWVSPEAGNRLFVKVIHEHDQFLQHVPPRRFEMTHSLHPDYGDYWSVRVPIAPEAGDATSWGQPGRYVYRYCLERPDIGEIDWVIDPFAREFGVGKLSAITLGYQPYSWSAAENGWRVPAPEDLVVYELLINEFGGDIDGAIERLGYLADLGVNCLEVMPVSNVANVVDWGFLPLGYFGVDERFGRRSDLQRLIDAAHQRGISVMLDVVYAHTSSDFAYSYLYRRLGYRENPFMGPFGADYFGESTDFRRKFTQDFYFTVNHHWLEVYHVDGYRYDCVPCFWDGPTGVGYANLVYQTYQFMKKSIPDGGHWSRFGDAERPTLIQCAEQLEAPVGVLNETYSTCTWQNETLGAAEGVAHGSAGDLVNLGFRLGLTGYPTEVVTGGDRIQKSALQYIENHDHARFVCNFGLTPADNELLAEGRRDLWYKVQPYLIGLLTARGIPLMWQGQELGENYFVPTQGLGRVALFRAVRWDYFYDEIGRSLVWLVRTLLGIRRAQPQFRRGGHFFYNHWDNYLSKRILLFSRSLQDEFSLVALNFGDTDQVVPFVFPQGGRYREELHGHDLDGVDSTTTTWLQVPSNYGRIWTLQRG